MADEYAKMLNVIHVRRGGCQQRGWPFGTSKGDPGYMRGGVRVEGRLRSGERSGCGFMMVAVQGLPGWRDVSGYMGFVLGQEVSREDWGW